MQRLQTLAPGNSNKGELQQEIRHCPRILSQTAILAVYGVHTTDCTRDRNKLSKDIARIQILSKIVAFRSRKSSVLSIPDGDALLLREQKTTIYRSAECNRVYDAPRKMAKLVRARISSPQGSPIKVLQIHEATVLVFGE